MHQFKSQGFSMVEMLVAMAIGVLILSGVIMTLGNSKQNFDDQNEMAFIQENSRFAIDLLSREIRMAGYMGCAPFGPSTPIANSVANSSGGLISTLGIEGFEGETTVAGFPAILDSPTLGTDAFIVRHADSNNALSIKNHNGSAAQIDIFGTHSYPVGTTFMLVDANCRQVGIFQMTGPSSATPSNVVHNTGGSPPDNCTKKLSGNFDCASCPSGSCADASSASYNDGSSLMQFVTTAYFISDSNILPGMPALKREVLVPGGTREEELVPGVEDMEILYGVDVTNDGEIDRYVNANQVDLNGSGTVTADEWNLVRSVRLTLTFRSQRTINPLTQTISTTVKLRNRG